MKEQLVNTHTHNLSVYKNVNNVLILFVIFYFLFFLGKGEEWTVTGEWVGQWRPTNVPVSSEQAHNSTWSNFYNYILVVTKRQGI